MTEVQKIIGAAIRRVRESKGHTLEALADLAGVSYQYLSEVETGKANATIQVLDRLAVALDFSLRILISTAYDDAAGNRPPVIDASHLRRNVPLPIGLTFDDLETVLNDTQSIIHRLNRNLIAESGSPLQDVIQGNNFSGLVSNILSNSFNKLSKFKHNHHQRYPDLVTKKGVGLEVKCTMKIGKGGESHNGHSGWHVIACYQFLPNGDIKFVHVMFADLNGHQHEDSDWSYVGSKVNITTGSRRTETYTTTGFGTTKLRDGSAYLDPNYVIFSRWRPTRNEEAPSFSIWINNGAATVAARKAKG